MFPPLTPVIKNLIIINVAIFVMIQIMASGNLSIPEYLPLYRPGTPNFQPFQFVTTMFTHFDLMHLLFNMIGLFFFGTLVEQRIGAKKTYLAYILGGIFSAAVFMLYYKTTAPLLGASGAVYTMLILCALYFKNMKVQLLFPPITLTMGVLALLYLGYDLFSFFRNAGGNIAHLAHLGGAAMGLILWFSWEKLGK